MLHFRLRALITTSLLLLPAALRADTLLDIYELAVKNDPVIKAAEATYRAGREFEVQGRSQLLPQVGAQAEYGETDVTQKSTRTIPIGDQRRTTTSRCRRSCSTCRRGSASSRARNSRSRPRCSSPPTSRS